MDMLSGSQISSFLSATSLLWVSSIVLIMIGLVYFIKYRERHDAGRNSKFFSLYIITIVLNVFEYVMNIVMQTNPPYETIVYRSYILIKFFWNISLMFYVVDFICSDKKTLFSIWNIFKFSLMILSLICCIFLDIDVVLESNGKFYVLIGTLNDVYTNFALILHSILLLTVICLRKKLPKGFCLLCSVTFFIYLCIIMFKNATGYMVKESVFIFSILVLIVFNTTSNQDKEFVNNLNRKKDALAKVNHKRTKLIDKITLYIGQALNDMVLFNDELYLTTDKSRGFIQNNSKEIQNTIDDLNDYLNNVKDIYQIESNKEIINNPYQLGTLMGDIDAKILPLADSKRIFFNISIIENSFINYIGDLGKIEKVLDNVLSTVIRNSNEGENLDLTISSKQADLNDIELSFTIKSNSAQSGKIKSLKLDDYVDDNQELNNDELKMVISNELLEIMNSKMNIKTDSNYTIYSFTVLQGFKDNELYSNIN